MIPTWARLRKTTCDSGLFIENSMHGGVTLYGLLPKYSLGSVSEGLAQLWGMSWLTRSHDRDFLFRTLRPNFTMSIAAF